MSNGSASQSTNKLLIFRYIFSIIYCIVCVWNVQECVALNLALRWWWCCRDPRVHHFWHSIRNRWAWCSKNEYRFRGDFHDDFMQIRLIFIPYQTRSTYSNPIQQNCLRKQTIKPIIEAKNLYHVRFKLDFTVVRYSSKWFSFSFT